jgi:predicted AAA+ superfamily ATPase
MDTTADNFDSKRSAEIFRVFREQNPWHETGRVPDAWAKTVERMITGYLPNRILSSETILPRRFHLLIGPRRVGKTTAMYQTVRSLLNHGVPKDSIWWLRLDHPILMRFSLDQLCSMIMDRVRHKGFNFVYFFFDELTYAEDWDLWLKTFYDDHRPIRILGTSSSTAALRNRRLESGVGRWEEKFLPPYSYAEYLSLLGIDYFIINVNSLASRLMHLTQSSDDDSNRTYPILLRKYLLTGGFPELLLASGANEKNDETALLESQRILRSDAVERAIYKDIPQAFRVEHPKLLERLLYTLAGQIAGILSPQNICSDLGGMSQPTFSRYLGYLESAFLVFTLENYSGNESVIQKRGRKLYFVDSAIRNAALQRGIAPLTDSKEMGLLIENMAAAHLHALGRECGVRVYYWREKQDEVDLIYDQPGEPLAFEIGMSEHHDRKGLRALIKRYPKFQNRCYVVAPHSKAIRAEESDDGIGSIPLERFLIAIGGQAVFEEHASIYPETRS